MPRRHLSLGEQGVAFETIKTSVLGKKYDLSVALISPTQMRRVMKYKPRRKVGAPTKASGKKNLVSNVLSFPLSKNSGEILICEAAAKPYTPDYLFIHGLLHLKGLRHGATMEKAEQKLLSRFNLCKRLSPGLMSAPTRLR